MKNLIVLLATSVLLTSLYSFSSAKKESKLIGSWKVESVVNSNGRVKKGRKIITISKDGTLDSVKDNGSKMQGFWEFEKNELRIYDRLGEKSEKFKIIKLTRKKLVLKDDRKTYNTVRV